MMLRSLMPSRGVGRLASLYGLTMQDEGSSDRWPVATTRTRIGLVLRWRPRIFPPCDVPHTSQAPPEIKWLSQSPSSPWWRSYPNWVDRGVRTTTEPSELRPTSFRASAAPGCESNELDYAQHRNRADCFVSSSFVDRV